jgi:bifunctional DNase/RNase
VPAEHNITCGAEDCTERAVFHLTWTQMRRLSGEQHLCEQHAKSILLSHDFERSIGKGEAAYTQGARCFDIELVVISEIHDEQVVYLKEVGGRRFFPLLIGIFEATSLDRHIKEFQSPRPLTHEAMLDAIDALDGVLQDVSIAGFEEQYYYADLRIRRNDQTILVDTRPSDAFVLAVLANKPIFISDDVLAKMGI